MMNDRITLQRREVGEDTLGQDIDVWPDIATVWAHVRFPSGAELIRAGAQVSVVKCSIRIRRRTDIDTAARVQYKGKVYNIESALPDDRDPRFMFLVCEGSK